MDNTMPPQIEERHSTSFFKKYRFTLLSLCIILIALIPLIILAKHKTTTPLVMHTQAVVIPTPTTVPLTAQNAQPTLDAVNQNMQQAITQSNQDLSSVNQIDTSQDSVAGL